MAGFVWRIDAPMELNIDARYQPFLTDAPRDDCSISFEISRPAELRGTVVHAENPRVLRLADGYCIERCLLAPEPCTCLVIRDADPLHVTGWIYPEAADYFRTLDNLLDAANLEHMLTALGVVSLHSSFITHCGQAILFSAPSGTGKSTQAALWEQYAHAEQINGDRSVIRCVDGVWTAFGFPFAGSSGIYKNKSAPIRAIVVLRQAKDNTIERLGASEAFRLLYSETAIQRWNTQGHAAAVDLLIRLSAAVPVYRLCCTPDARAVALLQQTLSSQEDSP
ncbi:MAG: hypothetical protein SPF59_08765 [Oscillospiraceae bacterium]|nr:hypothetical protein [Oscillospiraceae bacterium]